jgi:hypothetical protein
MIDPFEGYQEKIKELEHENRTLLLGCQLMSKMVGVRDDDESDEEFELQKLETAGELINHVLDIIIWRKIERHRESHEGDC